MRKIRCTLFLCSRIAGVCPSAEAAVCQARPNFILKFTGLPSKLKHTVDCKAHGVLASQHALKIACQCESHQISRVHCIKKVLDTNNSAHQQASNNSIHSLEKWVRTSHSCKSRRREQTCHTMPAFITQRTTKAISSAIDTLNSVSYCAWLLEAIQLRCRNTVEPSVS